MTLLTHGDEKSYTTCLIIGIPASQAETGYHYIVEIHPTSFKETLTNTPLHIPKPIVDNVEDVEAIMMNLRRLKQIITIKGFIYDTAADRPDNNIGYDQSYIEDVDNDAIFNETTGAITAPEDPAAAAQNVTSAVKKRWMLKELMKAGFQDGTKGLTMQYRDISNPSETDEREQEYHQKLTMTKCEITDTEDKIRNTWIVDSVQEVTQYAVNIELLLGDPTG